MELSRRSFLKTAGVGLGSLFALSALKSEPVMAHAPKAQPLKKQFGETTTICPFDGSGCGFIVASENGQVTNIEGDPDHPINRGGGCAKGQSIRQLAADNPRRLHKPLYRAPHGTEWKEVSWQFALDKIAERIKATRDESFEETNKLGQKVNRTLRIGSVGTAAMDNEECYIYQKFLRSLGLVYIEHQARI